MNSCIKQVILLLGLWAGSASFALPSLCAKTDTKQLDLRSQWQELTGLESHRQICSGGKGYALVVIDGVMSLVIHYRDSVPPYELKLEGPLRNHWQRILEAPCSNPEKLCLSAEYLAFLKDFAELLRSGVETQLLIDEEYDTLLLVGIVSPSTTPQKANLFIPGQGEVARGVFFESPTTKVVDGYVSRIRRVILMGQDLIALGQEGIAVKTDTQISLYLKSYGWIPFCVEAPNVVNNLPIPPFLSPVKPSKELAALATMSENMWSRVFPADPEVWAFNARRNC